MDVKVYSFPTFDDSVLKIEQHYCYLVNKYHRGDHLEPEQLDWMDHANTFLETSR